MSKGHQNRQNTLLKGQNSPQKKTCILWMNWTIVNKYTEIVPLKNANSWKLDPPPLPFFFAKFPTSRPIP